MKDFYTVKELAEKAGVNTSYIRQILIAKKLSGYKVGRDWMIPHKSGDDWLEARRVKALGIRQERF